MSKELFSRSVQILYSHLTRTDVSAQNCLWSYHYFHYFLIHAVLRKLGQTNNEVRLPDADIDLVRVSTLRLDIMCDDRHPNLLFLMVVSATFRVQKYNALCKPLSILNSTLSWLLSISDYSFIVSIRPGYDWTSIIISINNFTSDGLWYFLNRILEQHGLLNRVSPLWVWLASESGHTLLVNVTSFRSGQNR